MIRKDLTSGHDRSDDQDAYIRIAPGDRDLLYVYIVKKNGKAELIKTFARREKKALDAFIEELSEERQLPVKG